MANYRELWVIVGAFGGFFLVLFIVFKVLDTEFFRGDPELGGSARAAANDMTAQAYARCVEKAAQELNLTPGRAHPEPDYSAWDLGFSRYLVKASIDSGPPAGSRIFLCKTLHEGEIPSSGWSVQSLEFQN